MDRRRPKKPKQVHAAMGQIPEGRTIVDRVVRHGHIVMVKHGIPRIGKRLDVSDRELFSYLYAATATNDMTLSEGSRRFLRAVLFEESQDVKEPSLGDTSCVTPKENKMKEILYEGEIIATYDPKTRELNTDNAYLKQHIPTRTREETNKYGDVLGVCEEVTKDDPFYEDLLFADLQMMGLQLRDVE